MAFTVFHCGKKRELKTCPQCGADVKALVVCSFPLRGPKSGQVCSKEICHKCGIMVGGSWFCRPHHNILRKDASK